MRVRNDDEVVRDPDVARDIGRAAGHVQAGSGRERVVGARKVLQTREVRAPAVGARARRRHLHGAAHERDNGDRRR